MARTSRYQTTPPFKESPGQPRPFAGLRPRPLTAATPVLEHTVKSTDRLDLLALHYYNDSRHWWRILDANPELLCGADLSDPALVGSVILIPAAEEPGGSK
jgi:nucleoid-associated protein YgaU